MKNKIVLTVCVCIIIMMIHSVGGSLADGGEESESVEPLEDAVVEDDLGKSRDGSRTDDEVVAR